MKELVGTPGTVSGLMMRLGQCGFAAGSVAYMITAVGFSGFTAFCYLIAAMGLQLLWSLGLACLDIYALRIKRDLLNPVLVSLLTLFVIGDWVTATLSLAAACSSAGVIILYGKDFDFCETNMSLLGCDRFKMSIAMAFASWGLVAMSSHVMFWILASST